MRSRIGLLAGTATVLLFGWQPASAKDAPPVDQAATPATGAPDSDVQDIIVTAQRRATNLQQTPVAVTAISSGALERGNISSTQDLMQVVPSLQVSTQTAGDGGGSASFFLRGMGQQRSGNGSGPAVGVYVDDFYYPSLEGSIFDVVDLDSVEVLRGPQGTLFGRNTIGGAIRYISAQPQLGSLSGRVSGTYGSYNRTDITGTINLPLGNIAALRVTAGHLQRDGFVRVQSGGPDAGATKTDLVRAQLKIEPTSDLTINVSGLYDRSRLEGFTYDIPGPLTPVPGGTLPFAYNTFIAPALGLPLYDDALKSTCFYCQPGPSGREFSTTKYENLLGSVIWEIAPSITVKSLTGWQRIDNDSAYDLDGTPIPLYYSGIVNMKENVFSQELQMSGQAIAKRMNFIGGLFYYFDSQPFQTQLTTAVVAAAPAANLPPQDQVTRSYAAYVDMSFKVTDKLTVLGGYRHSIDDRHTSVPSASLSAKRSFNSDTWRAGLQYQWAPDVMTYVTASTGFRAGGFNQYQATINAVVPFEPETVRSYEAGARLQFLDHKLTINPTFFFYNWDQIQVQVVFFPPGSALSAVLLQNAGKAHGKGFELEWNLAPVSGLRLFGSLATLDLHYTSIGSATGITVDSPLQRAPKLTWSLGGSYMTDLASAGSIALSANWSYQDKQASTPTDSDRLLLPSYHLLTARIEWIDPSKTFSLAVFGTNLTKTHYYVGGVNYYSNVGAAHYDLGRPREFGVAGRVNF